MNHRKTFHYLHRVFVPTLCSIAVYQEEERRIALVMARKEEEKKRQDNRIAIMKVSQLHPLLLDVKLTH